MARELIAAAKATGDPLATSRRNLMHTINAWERGVRRPSEMYWLLYVGIFPDLPSQVACAGGAPQPPAPPSPAVPLPAVPPPFEQPSPHDPELAAAQLHAALGGSAARQVQARSAETRDLIAKARRARERAAAMTAQISDLEANGSDAEELGALKQQIDDLDATLAALMRAAGVDSLRRGKGRRGT